MRKLKIAAPSERMVLYRQVKPEIDDFVKTLKKKIMKKIKGFKPPKGYKKEADKHGYIGVGSDIPNNQVWISVHPGFYVRDEGEGKNYFIVKSRSLWRFNLETGLFTEKMDQADIPAPNPFWRVSPAWATKDEPRWEGDVNLPSEVSDWNALEKAVMEQLSQFEKGYNRTVPELEKLIEE